MEQAAITALHDALDAKFAKDLVVLDLTGLSPLYDYFVIATGGSAPQMTAMADTAHQVLGKHDIPLKHTEGVRSGKWVLLDFGSIVVHFFDQESREYYNLERIWGDAKVVSF
jgi:ribosome-associated protein